MDKRLVSIVVPNYNYGRYLRDCINSVIVQTYKNWELIFVDDNSTDGSREIVRDYIRKYPHLRIKLLHNKKGPSGTATPMNIGIHAMQGEYFAWLSSDDRFHPDKLARQILALEENQHAGMVYSRTFEINDQGSVVRRNSFLMPSSRRQFLQKLLETNFINGNTVVIRKNVLDQAGPLPERSKEYPDIYRAAEYYLWLKMSLLTRVIAMNEGLHYARLHSENSPYMKSGLGEKLKGYFISAFFKDYNILEISKMLGLNREEEIYCEAIIRKEMEKTGYSQDSIRRHDSLIKLRPVMERKVVAKMADISRSEFLIKSSELNLGIGKTEEAIRYLKEGLRLNPYFTDMKVRYTCASYLKTQGRTREAERIFKSIIRDEPLLNSSFRTGACFHLGEISFNAGNKIKAKEYFSLCFEENPEHRKAAEYLEELGCKSRIKDYWDIGAEKEPFKVIADIETKKDFELSGIADANMIMRHIGKKRLKDVLEIGCGMGRIMKPLSHVSRTIVGVDKSKEMILQAEEYLRGINNKKVAWVEQEKTPFKTRSFDFIYSHIVFMHMARKRFISWVREAQRLLKSDGIFWFQIFADNGSAIILPQDSDQAGGTRAYSKKDIEEIAGRHFSKINIFTDKLDRYEGKHWYFCICKSPFKQEK